MQSTNGTLLIILPWKNKKKIKKLNCIALNTLGCKTSEQHLHSAILAQHLFPFPYSCPWDYPALTALTPHLTPPRANILEPALQDL